MSGVLRLANTGGSNGRSTIVAAASSDATFTLPSAGGTILTTDFDTVGDITWNASNINITNADLNVNSGQLFIDESTGFVGIGTTSPNYKLQIRNTNAGNDPGHLFLQNASSTLGTEVSIILSPNLVGDVIRAAKITGINTGGNATDIAFYTNVNAQTPNEVARINSDGRVGIGTSSPSSRLHLKGGSLTTEHSSPVTGTGQFNINCENTSQVSFSYDDEGQISFGSSSAPATQTGFTERMRIDSDGRVLINSGGSVTNVGRLEVRQDVDLSEGVIDFDDVGGPHLALNNRLTGGANIGVSQSCLLFKGRNSGGSTFRSAITGSDQLRFYIGENLDLQNTPQARITGDYVEVSTKMFSAFTAGGTGDTKTVTLPRANEEGACYLCTIQRSPSLADTVSATIIAYYNGQGQFEALDTVVGTYPVPGLNITFGTSGAVTVVNTGVQRFRFTAIRIG